MATLKTYRAKRDFGKTPEPAGKKARGQGKRRYVIQKHAASRLHYDLRLEHDGVMMSWAVTRGPSLVPGDKRLAIHVEDHPIEYNTFEGTIPKGQYGGGTVMVWDQGTWTPEHDAAKGMKKGHLDFALHGKKLKGRWHLVRLRPRPGERQEPWLLIKSDDEHARKQSDPDILEEKARSAVSNRTIGQIAEGKSRVWQSNKPVAEQSSRVVSAREKAAMRAGGRKAPAKARARAPRRKAAAEKSSGKKSARKDKRAGRAGGRFNLSAIAGARRGPMPSFVPPCLATLSERAPSTPGWVHEIKFDGYRIQARIEDGAITLRTRTGLDWTRRFPTIAGACAEIDVGAALLDGEIVAIGETRAADFSALQDDLKSGRHDRLAYCPFDLLHLEGFDLTGAALLDRKEALARVLDGTSRNGLVQMSEHFDIEGPELLEHARTLNLEGIVSKRGDAPYHSGRRGDWIKVKVSSSQELVIAGYEPSDKKGRAIRSLLLAYFDKGRLRYAGRVGTGWSAARERELMAKLTPLVQTRPPFDPLPEAERRSKVTWVKPELVAEIDFRGWTGGTLVRQASFKGLREDKPAKQVARETGGMPKAKQAALRRSTPTKTAKTRSRNPAKGKNAVTVAGVALTHPERVYWPDVEVTKTELAQYYEQVWKWMAPHVTGRVLALVRCPDGQQGQCFYQKHASAGIDTSHLHLVREPDGEESISVETVSGLIALAQSGVLEVHVRGSTVEHLEKANRLIFDLDPGPGVDWKAVKQAAVEIRDALQALKLRTFVKTTGGKGLHVVLPIAPTPWDEAKEFCRQFAEALAGHSPGRYTTTVKKAARKNKIFIDYLRNSREATAISPYSTRARPGATVAVPIAWDELARLKAPNTFNVNNLPQRLARLRTDPWKDMGRLRPSLPELGKAR